MSKEIDIASIPCCPENFEPLFKLGLCFDAKKKIEESIKCYQKCIRIKDDDRRLWQCLAQAYFARGSFVNANKCFVKALQLRQEKNDEAKDFYEEIRIGEIKTLLGAYEEALTIYQEILKKSSDNTLALIGTAKIQLINSEEKFIQKEIDEAYKLCDEVLTTAKKIANLRPDLILPLNLVINCCLLIYQHSQDGKNFEVLGANYTRFEILELAKKHALKALSLKNFPYLWYHLFIIFSLMYTESGEIDYLKKSIICLEKLKDK